LCVRNFVTRNFVIRNFVPAPYTLVAGREPEACHGAEADCVTLLKAVAVCGSAFTTWLTQSATPFLEVKKM
jgi:hypothetical protein